eukprot:1424161-Amphidinium_carterae.1
MKILMKRSGQQHLKRAYDSFQEGSPGQPPIPRQEEKGDTDGEEAQSAYDSSLNTSTRASYK